MEEKKIKTHNEESAAARRQVGVASTWRISIFSLAECSSLNSYRCATISVFESFARRNHKLLRPLFKEDRSLILGNDSGKWHLRYPVKALLPNGAWTARQKCSCHLELADREVDCSSASSIEHAARVRDYWLGVHVFLLSESPETATVAAEGMQPSRRFVRATRPAPRAPCKRFHLKPPYAETARTKA